MVIEFIEVLERLKGRCVRVLPTADEKISWTVGV
jgi:hypothetical protein